MLDSQSADRAHRESLRARCHAGLALYTTTPPPFLSHGHHHGSRRGLRIASLCADVRLDFTGQMAAVTEHPRTSLSATKIDGSDGFLRARVVPVRPPTATNQTPVRARSIADMSVPSVTSDPMEVSTPKSASPIGHHASDGDVDGRGVDHLRDSPSRDHNALTGGMSMAAPPPAAAAIHQPKIVQTAFIHKLYK